jgi:hypothetical protein
MLIAISYQSRCRIRSYEGLRELDGIGIEWERHLVVHGDDVSLFGENVKALKKCPEAL